MKIRPNNLKIEDYNDWVKENELEYQPENWVADCWRPTGMDLPSFSGRARRYWVKINVPMYQLTYMSLHKLQENPFSAKLHAAHDCNNKWCVNPYHITPKTPEQNENDKKQLKGWETYRKQQSATQLKLRAENRVMPNGLPAKEKAQWILDNDTYTDENGCMIYTRQKDEQGYGKRNITDDSMPLNGEGKRRKKLQMHRFVHTVMNNLPYGTEENPWNARGKDALVAHHTCNVTSCINPDHIELVPQSVNVLAAMAYSKSAKITEENAREIIEAYLEVEEWPLGSKKAFARHYAEKFGVGEDVTLNLVSRKRTWKFLLQEYGLIKEKN